MSNQYSFWKKISPRLLKLWVKNRYYQIQGKPTRIYIYSFGGSGTRTFYEFVKRFKLVNEQTNVHWGQVEQIKKTDRVIYLYSNPVLSVKSFYRKDGENGKFIEQHCRNLRIPTVEDNTISAYAAAGKDSFHLHSHFKKHISNNPYNYPVLMVRFESIWDHLEEVMKYIGLEKHIDEFPPYRERKGEKLDITDKDNEQLIQIYQEMNDKLDTYPPVFLKKPHN